jgi:citrate synthase
VEALVEAMAAAGRPAPNVDVALVAVSHALGIAAEATPALFAIARTAGWTAHVLEQYRAGFLVRPRARYFDAT